jgi:group I intron endonuclease
MTIICGVYTITNTTNGKQYIGQSLDVLQRWRQHRHRLDEGTHLNAHLQAAWKLHGADAFVFQVLHLCEPATLGATEEAALAAVPPDLRYNIGPAGDNPTRGLTHGEVVRANMSRAKGGRPVVATNVQTGEERRFPYLQRAVEDLGLSQPHAWACCHGKRTSTNGWRVCFDEAHAPAAVPPKEKKPKRPDRRSREVVGTHVDTGEEIRFPRVAAVREHGFIRESVIKCLAGQMHTHEGYRWRYIDGQPHATLDNEWKNKLRKARTRGASVSRPVIGKNTQTGEETTYPYIAEAARAVGCPPSYISLCLTGRLKTAGGCTWRRPAEKKEGP